jgi:hypothetical protein
MLACVCADADAQLRLLRALVAGLAGDCNADAAGKHIDEATENCTLPHDRAVWYAGPCELCKTNSCLTLNP